MIDSLKNKDHLEGLTGAQEALALSLFSADVILFDFEKGFRLKAHETNPNLLVSPIYIDLRRLQSNLEAKHAAVAALIEQTQGLEFDRIAGIPMSAVAIASTMADMTGIPQITPRTDKKTYGSGSEIDGTFYNGDVVLVVDDLVTRADSKLEAIELLERNNLKVKDVAVIFDREQGGAESLQERGYNLHSALKIKPILQLYARLGKITQLELNRVLNYLEVSLGK